MDLITLLMLIVSITCYMWLSSYRLFYTLTPASLSAAVWIYLSFIKALFNRRLKLSKTAAMLFVLSISIFCWISIVILINQAYDDSFRRLFQILFGILIAIALYYSIDSYKQITLITWAFVFAASVSALIAIGQYFVGEPFIGIWLKTRETSKTLDRFLNDMVVGKRVTGLAAYSIPLGYELSAIIPFILAYFVYYRKSLGIWKKTIVFLFIFILGLALFLTQTRSAIIGGLIGCALVLLINSNGIKYPKTMVIISVIGILAIYWALGYFTGQQRLLNIMDSSGQTRIPMQIVALIYAMENPLGTAKYIVSDKHIPGYIQSDSIRQAILNNTTHSHFLNILVYYGFPAFFLLLLFCYVIYKDIKNKLIYARLNKDSHFSWLIAGISGFFTSYLINSMVHNAGPFTGDIFNWYIIGLLMALDKLLYKEDEFSIIIRQQSVTNGIQPERTK